MKQNRRLIEIITILLMVIGFMIVSPVTNVQAKNDTHHLAFGSDRHQSTTAISNTMGQMPQSVEYVGLIGDMVNYSWNTSNISVLQDEVWAVFSDSRPVVHNIYGGHDYWMTEDVAGIMQCKGPGSSGLIYTGYNSDGTVAYHIYGISYDDLAYNDYTAGYPSSKTVSSPEVTSEQFVARCKTAANKFKTTVDQWNDAGDQAPVFVLSHAPLHCARGDNIGAFAWNDALNYAATGSVDGTKITRNVIFMHGHNHTNETNSGANITGERYYAPGSQVVLQKEDYNKDYEIQQYMDSTALANQYTRCGGSKTIQYTYLTPGYLRDNSTATLLTLKDTSITLTKYRYSDSGTSQTTLAEIALVHTHNYKKPVWSWEGTTKASAAFTCTAGDDTQTINASITSENGTMSNEGARLVTYTATVTFEGKTYTDQKTIVESSSGVTYGEPEVEWSSDLKTVTLTFTGSDGSTERVTGNVSKDVTQQATCTEEGVETYTAVVSFKGLDYTFNKEKTLDALGHEWTSQFEWNDTTSAQLILTCSRCQEVKTIDATITSKITKTPTATEKGIRTYTAKATYDGKEYTDTKEKSINSINDTHYLAFTSYFGTDEANEPATVFAKAPDNVEYVNIVGHRNQYSNDASSLVSSLAAEFSNATIQLVCGDSDSGSATGITSVCKGAGTSGLIYTGKNSDSSVAYYVYGIAYEDMKDASNAQAAVNNFNNWLNTIDASIPIIVTSYAPIHYHASCQDWAHSKCNDSYGASLWNEALNTASTNGSSKRCRNVIFIHGKNNSEVISWNNKTGEYYYTPGSTVSIQDSNGNGVDTTIQYTYWTSGYASNTYKSGSLLTINGEKIILTRYHNGEVDSDNEEDLLISQVEDHEHTYGDPAFELSSDKKTVTATFACAVENCTHKETVTQNVTATITTEATCETEGKVKYSASVTFNGQEYPYETTETLAATGHNYDYENIEWNWSDDKKSATATVICLNNSTHTDTATATISSKTTVEATCESSGTKTYTATVTFDGKDYIDTKIEMIPALGHSLTEHKAVAATCTKEGNSAYWSCDRCGKYFSDKDGKSEIEKNSWITPILEHTWDQGEITKAPTADEEGEMTYTCQKCGTTRKETIPKETVSDNTESSGDGTTAAETPTSTAQTNVPDSASGSDPYVRKGSASVRKTDKIIRAVADNKEPAGAVFGKLKAKASKSGKNSNKLKWNKVPGASGYIIYGNRCGKPYKYQKLVTVKSNTWTQKKLKKGTYYKYIVVAYRITAEGQYVIATSKSIHTITKGNKKYTVAKSLKVNKKKVTLKKGKAFKLKAKEVPLVKKSKIQHHRKVAFESSNNAIATVNSKGKIKAKKKGSCKIFVYAQNGVYKTITVKVK